MIFLHIFQCHHFSFLIVILLFVIIPTYAHIRSIVVNISVFQGTYLRCHWTVTPVPSPMTLIFPQLRWQEVSIVCTETRTLLSVSLFHLCEMKQGFFFTLPKYMALMHRRVLFSPQAVTEVEKHSLGFILSLSRWLFSIITHQLRASLSCGLAVRSPLPGPIQPTPANSYRREELKLWLFQLKFQKKK